MSRVLEFLLSNSAEVRGQESEAIDVCTCREIWRLAQMVRTPIQILSHTRVCGQAGDH